MRTRPVIAAAAVAALALTPGVLQGRADRLNSMIDLLKAKKPVFGLYQPNLPRPAGGQRGAGGAAATAAPAPAPALVVTKTQMDLAKEALAYANSDFIFTGSMEGGVDRGIAQYAEFVSALHDAGALVTTPSPRLPHPLAVKTPKIAPDPAKAIENISRQLNLGVSAIVFVGVESAHEVEQGLAAMRFKSRGGTRPDDVGTAPAFWGMSDADYRKKADVWPLNPDGELVNWTIVESKEGLAHLDEIASVKGISVLFPGAGTLRGVFTTTDADGKRVFDSAGWEHAIQQVLGACKKYQIPCGYPATADDIEMRMQQGFSFFVINWGDPGFTAVDIGRRVAGRTEGK